MFMIYNSCCKNTYYYFIMQTSGGFPLFLLEQSLQRFVDFFFEFVDAWEADVLEGLGASGIVDGVGGDTVRLEMVEHVIILLPGQVVVVAINILNHLLPCGQG